jgi:hypothetical protein
MRLVGDGRGPGFSYSQQFEDLTRVSAFLGCPSFSNLVDCGQGEAEWRYTTHEFARHAVRTFDLALGAPDEVDRHGVNVTLTWRGPLDVRLVVPSQSVPDEWLERLA